MAIAAKRFKFLNEETNVAVSDFISNTSDIFNSVNNEVKQLLGTTEDFIKGAVKDSGIQGLKDKIPKDEIREVKQLYGNLKDLTKFSTKDIDNAIKDLLPDNPVVQSAFGKLSGSCKTKALSKGGLGKPYDANINCNGKSRKANAGSCNSGELSNVLNKLTNGSYNAEFSDMNRNLKNLMALSSYGYDMNMCGVFGALSGSLNKDLLSRASGALLGQLSSGKNVLGILDLAGASAGLHTLLEYPKGITDSLTNFKNPIEFLERDQVELGDRFKGAMTLFKDGWDKSDVDDLLSLSSVESYNSELDTTLSCGRLGNSFTEDELDEVFEDDDSVFSAAYSAKAEEPNQDYNYDLVSFHKLMGEL
jgi:hypothetical protein